MSTDSSFEAMFALRSRAVVGSTPHRPYQTPLIKRHLPDPVSNSSLNRQLASQTVSQITHCLTLRFRDYMPVQSQRDSWVAVSQLCLYHRDWCSPVNYFARYRVPEGVEPRHWYTQLSKQWA
jgi:hypothetical protein